MNGFEKRLDDLTKRIEALEKKNEIKPESKSNRTWVPYDGELVYYWSFLADIPESGSYNDRTSWFSTLYNMGLLFRNMEDCFYDHTQRCVIKQFQDLAIEAGELDNPWPIKNNSFGHWYVYYIVEANELICACTTRCRENVVYFPSKVALESAIKEIGEGNVIKYICGIKDYKGE